MEKRIWVPLVLFWVNVFVLGLAQANNVPAIFILGDSTADVGTNNFLPFSNAKANFPHNGIDFPQSIPTGRFSNGLNSADILAKLFGFEISPPPFFSLNIKSLRKKNFKGINFASGGSGLLDITGQSNVTLTKSQKEKIPSASLSGNHKNVITLKEQIRQFAAVRRALIAIKGKAVTKKYLSKSLFFISIGSNDIFGYFHSNSSVPKNEFLSTLVLAYENHLQSLLKLGAKKFGIISVPPVGCCPSQRVFNATEGCLEELNELAGSFYSLLNDLLYELSSEYKDMKYSLGNTYEMTINVIKNPVPFNFTEVKAACCGAGNLSAESFCTPDANLCPNRHEYLFWDLFHPTEAASQLAAITLFSGPSTFVAPINFAQLAEA